MGKICISKEQLWQSSLSGGDVRYKTTAQKQQTPVAELQKWETAEGKDLYTHTAATPFSHNGGREAESSSSVEA